MQRAVNRIIHILQANASTDFAKEFAVAEELTHLVRQEIIQRITKPFNDTMRQQPSATYEDKKETCKWANDRLRQLGLAIKCPMTGTPGILWGNRARQSDMGRFTVEASVADGERKPTRSFPKWIDLDLTEAVPRRVSWARGRLPGPAGHER
jgi:hypothetical protein